MQLNTPEGLRSRLRVNAALQFLSAFCYATLTSILISGLWTVWSLVAVYICHTICTRAATKRPNLLILRRFGRAETEEFLARASGGLSGFAQPIWLVDLRAKPWIRRNLPGALLYYTRPFAWMCVGFAIHSQTNGGYPATFAWISWMVIGTCSYHRYVSGALPTAWISCCAAAIIVAITWRADLLLTPSSGVKSWPDVAVPYSYFAATWVTCAILLQLKLFRKPFNLMYVRRVMFTLADVKRYSQELRCMPLWRRFTTITQLQVLQVNCTTSIWAKAVYETLSVSSIAVADVSDVSADASLVWELEQCRSATIPVVLTCEESSIKNAKTTLAERGLPCEPIFCWQRSEGGLGSVSFDPEGFSKHFFSCVRSHLNAELAYRPPRMSWEEAQTKLEVRHWDPSVESSSAQA